MKKEGFSALFFLPCGLLPAPPVCSFALHINATVTQATTIRGSATAKRSQIKILLILYINRHLFRSENLSIIILYNITLSVLCALPIDRKLLIIHINNIAYALIWRENALYTLFDFKREFICGLSKKHTGFNLSKTTL